MLSVKLTYSTPDGPQEIVVDGSRLSFGRGSEAEYRFADDGLSRLHATIYREAERVWIVDENSTNGTHVNGVAVSSVGTPLKEGDLIRIGHFTNLRVSIVEERPAIPSTSTQQSASVSVTSSPSSSTTFSLIPVVVIAAGLFIISVSAVFIGFTFFGRTSAEVVEKRDDDLNIDNRSDRDTSHSPRPTPTVAASPVNSQSPDNTTLSNTPIVPDSTPQPNVSNGKKYLEMTDAERRQYLEAKAMRVAQIIGNNNGGAIPAEAIDKIKGFTDAYATRMRAKPRSSGCGFGDNLQSTFERASKNAPFINRAFNEKGIDPRIGLYLAMIESEHCICLQSPTGPLGMFQFTRATAALHGLKVFAGASPSNPDERCEPEPAARAAASYMKALTGRYGTGPASIPLAIGSYNSGEGGLSSNLEKALSSGQGLPRDFWTLIAKGDILSKQFQAENFKYVPKFFAAAIIGENPQDFGLNLQPLSTYTR
jgi:pSer/pThr/pTyr-binding forkhead associated (FHA) protein